MLPDIIVIFQLYKMHIWGTQGLMNFFCNRGDLSQDVVCTRSISNYDHNLSNMIA